MDKPKSEDKFKQDVIQYVIDYLNKSKVSIAKCFVISDCTVHS